MLTFLVRRLLLAVPVLLGVVFVVMLTVDLLPGDAVTLMLGEHATKDAVAKLRDYLGLDKPFAVRYLEYVGRVARGDLGRSIQQNRPVADELADAWPALAPGPAGRHPGPALGGDGRAHDPLGGARRPARGLRAHGARQGRGRVLGAGPPCAPQRLHPDRHAARPAVGPADGRRRPHRDRVRVAGPRAPDGEGHLRARLRAAAGRRPAVRAGLRDHRPRRRSLVRLPRPARGQAGLMEGWARFRRNRLALLGLVLVAVLALTAVLAPWIAPYDPTHQSLIEKRARPGTKFWLGADEFGRDILSRVIYGSRVA